MTKNPGHVKRRARPARPPVATRGLAARNRAAWRGPGEEPRNVQKSGGGVRGMRMGGAVTGRRKSSPARVTSNREPKPRGRDR